MNTQFSRKKAHIEDAEETEEISEPLSVLTVSISAAASKVKIFLKCMSHIDNQHLQKFNTRNPIYLFHESLL